MGNIMWVVVLMTAIPSLLSGTFPVTFKREIQTNTFM